MKKLLLSFTALALSACANTGTVSYEPKSYIELKNPEWAKDAVLYQINTRQFSPEGTFKAAEAQLDRLKSMGVDIVWLMPIHPIGEKNRKGSLGSPYSVKDFFGVNPEFGTMEDLKSFVNKAHSLGMHVILDLVANHTAWDNKMVTDHPDWYEKDWRGNYHPTPWWDWSDIIDLNYDKAELREYMTRAMVYWVKEADIDGYRADVAGYVPLDFWETARTQMEKVKPVFMLGEWQERDLHKKAFDATYAWDWYNTAHNVAQGKGDATSFYGFYSGNESAWPWGSMRMAFTENHDKNAWEATQYEAFGEGLKAIIALSFIGEGIPLVHNGQEACNKKRLEFFEKDPIKWQKCDLEDHFTKLIAFKSANPALFNGNWGARMVKVENDNPKQVFSFVRMKDNNKVLGIFNLSNQIAKVKFTDNLPIGEYKDFNGKAVRITNEELTLEPWGFLALAN